MVRSRTQLARRGRIGQTPGLRPIRLLPAFLATTRACLLGPTYSNNFLVRPPAVMFSLFLSRTPLHGQPSLCFRSNSQAEVDGTNTLEFWTSQPQLASFRKPSHFK